jgi:hypothetical protein
MDLPKRKLQRLHGFDYSKANYYFVTICTNERNELFGEIGKPNEFGSIAEAKLLEIENHYENVFVDNVLQKSLKDSAEEWAELGAQMLSQYAERSDTTELIQKAGYDMGDLASKLYGIYMS